MNLIMTKIRRLFLSDTFILTLIIINGLIIFISGFNLLPQSSKGLIIVDDLITFVFIIELIIKINYYGIKRYFSSGWNLFDFILIVISVPALLGDLFQIWFGGTLELNYLLVLRVFRVFKTFRFIKFIPGIEKMILGVTRALKSSIIILVGFLIYLFIIGVLSFQLFNGISTDYFGNPLTSLYSTFKIFTIEGWFVIPETITQDMNHIKSTFTYLYFIFILITGGVIGLSLINSIFVDAMVSDNNDNLEDKVDILNKKVDTLLKELNKNKIN